MTTTADPARRILHCDMDCFYAAVHQRDDPPLRGRPVVVGGSPNSRGVVAAASYEARQFGVRSAMPSAHAARLCPHATFLRPDFARYSEESRRIFAIFRDFTPLVQPISIDEAYLDVTAELAGHGSATAVARAIRQRVRSERGLAVSVGVASSRLVAKIASDAGKPDGLVVVPPPRVLDFLAPLSVRALPGIGPATERNLQHELGASSIGALRALPLERLTARLGRHGETLHRYAHGIDLRPFEVQHQRKSLSAERTYSRDLSSLDAMELELERLADEVAAALQRRGLRGATVVLKVRYGDFVTLTRSRTLAQPVDDPHTLASVARDLLRRTQAPVRPVRLLGLGVSKIGRPGDDAQLVLFPSERPRPAETF